MIKCKCGCGESILGRRKDRVNGKPIYYKHGHNNKGKSLVGDNAKYHSLHIYVKKHWPEPIPIICSICSLEKELELCNISKEYNVVKRLVARDPIILATYNKDFKNWFWACESCHMIYEGRGKGEKRSEETKQKMSESQKRRRMLEAVM